MLDSPEITMESMLGMHLPMLRSHAGRDAVRGKMREAQVVTCETNGYLGKGNIFQLLLVYLISGSSGMSPTALRRKGAPDVYVVSRS